MSRAWESSDFRRLLQTTDKPVLPTATFRLALTVSCLNATLWLVATVLQAVLLSETSYDQGGSGYVIVLVTTCWSTILEIVACLSIYGLIRNTLKDIKSFLIVKGFSAILSFVIFILDVIVLTLETTEQNWVVACGFCVFTGLYVFGESCIIVAYLTREWRIYRNDLEEERIDRLRQQLYEQQREQLDILTRSSLLAPPFAIPFELDESDRLHIYPPVYV